MVNRRSTAWAHEASRPALLVRPVEREETVLGAFQREKTAVFDAGGRLVTRRASGGPAIAAGPGSVHLALFLPSPSALVPCDPPRLLNRHVRPLLRALGKVGAKAAYFGRDVVHANGRPAAWIGFAHRVADGRSLVEAIVAVSSPLVVPGARGPRTAKVPWTIDEAVGKRLPIARVEEAIRAAYEDAFGTLERLSHVELRPLANDDRRPFAATIEEAIGTIGAISDDDDVAIGGDFFASDETADALDAAFGALSRDAGEDELRAAIVGAVASSGGVLEGVRDLESIVRVASEARSKRGSRGPS